MLQGDGKWPSVDMDGNAFSSDDPERWSHGTEMLVLNLALQQGKRTAEKPYVGFIAVSSTASRVTKNGCTRHLNGSDAGLNRLRFLEPKELALDPKVMLPVLCCAAVGG